jgi:vacuolar-type H+-ATPase subunit H
MIRDILRRFRPAGAPGPATGAGVPVDHLAEIGTELAPILALLVDTREQAAGIRQAAEVEARRRIAEADQASARMLAEAHARAAAARAEAFTAGRAEADRAGAATMTAARREAGLIRARARSRLSDYVDRAAGLALAEVGVLDAAVAGDSDRSATHGQGPAPGS